MSTLFRAFAQALWAFVICITSTGCASMSVQVQVLDAEYFDDPKVVNHQMTADVRAEAAAVAKRLESGRFDRETTAQVNQIAAQLRRLVDVGGVEETDVPRLLKPIQPRVDAIRKAYADGLATYRATLRLADHEQRLDGYRKAGSHFAEGARLSEDLAASLKRELAVLVNVTNRRIAVAERQAAAAGRRAAAPRTRGASTVPATSQPAMSVPTKASTRKSRAELAAAQATATREIARLRNSIIPGKGLFNDPLVSLVVHAPDRYWKNGEPTDYLSWRRNGRRTLFNDTRASGYFGNTDIAIKMEYDSPGNFTLKGMRLDAREVTSATFKALRSGIELAAMMYGIPLPKSTAEGTDDALQTSSQEFASAEDQRRAAGEQRRDVRRATVAILDAIVAEGPALADRDRFATASANIRSVYQAYRTRLQTPAPAEPQPQPEPAPEPPPGPTEPAPAEPSPDQPPPPTE